MSYTRVIPRDLFNEAKLLKCLGKLALYIHDAEEGCAKVLELYQEEEGQAFKIKQCPHTGDLFCSNLHLLSEIHRTVPLTSKYNSKDDPWPLWFHTDEESEKVFTEIGAFSPEFMKAMGFGND